MLAAFLGPIFACFLSTDRTHGSSDLLHASRFVLKPFMQSR